MIKFLNYFLLTLLFFSSSCFANDFESEFTKETKEYKRVKLIDVIVESLSYSDLVKVSREKVTQAKLKVDSAYADYYPIIDLTYSRATTKSSPSEEEGADYKVFQDNSYKLVLTQNIYNGGKTHYTVLKLKKDLELKTNQYELIINKEMQKAIKAYFSVVFSYRSIIVNERNMQKLNKILEITNIKFESGAISKGDISSIKSNVANAKTKLLKVKSKFTEALNYYEYIVGEKFQKTLPYEKNFNIELSDFDLLYDRAIKNNKNLKNYTKSIKMEKYNLKSIKSSFKPDVEFTLKYKNILDQEDYEKRESSKEAKVNITYNIYNGGRDQNKVLTSYSKIKAFNHNLNEEKRKLKWNLSKLFNSVSSTKEALKSNKSEVLNSREMTNSYWEAYELGEQDLQVLMQGQKQLNTAELALVNYENSYMNDFFKMLELSGDLFNFFKIDPSNPMFVDFSQSNYNSDIYVNPQSNKNDTKSETVKQVELSDTIYDNIKKFEEKILKLDDSFFTIEISAFSNIYDSIEFMKNKKIYDQFLPYDVINNYKLSTNIIYKYFENKEDAQKEVDKLKKDVSDKSFIIKTIKEVKENYTLYKNGLTIEKETEVVEKVVEKIVEKIVEKTIIKKEEPLLPYTNYKEFKDNFLASDGNFTLNIGSFRSIDDIEAFTKKHGSYENTFFFLNSRFTKIYKLVYGNYASYEEAKTAYDKLDENIKKIFLPVIEKVNNVKNQYEKYSNSSEIKTKK